MEFLTKDEFIKIEESNKYYHGRWPYFQAVIDILKEENFKKVLELGAYKTAVVKGSDTMSIDKPVNYVSENPDPNFRGNSTYFHDATKNPWPIKSCKYDLFIALQVWEHLEDKQKEAFREVMRISKAAILSFPFKWYCPGDCHHNITENRIKKWTLGIKPVEIKQSGSRIIYFFKFKNGLENI